MFSRLFILAAMYSALLASLPLQSQTADSEFVEHYYQLVNDSFDKQAAFNTVAFVEKYWRVVGNEGFDKSIYHVAEKLKAAGFVEESEASSGDRLVYRIEKRALRNPTWEPVSGSLKMASGEVLLDFETNRNMIAMRSYSTGGPKEFEVVDVSKGKKLKQDLKGKLVFGETSPGLLFQEAVQKRGAAGVITYGLPGYLQPQKNVNSIQFTGIGRDEQRKSFGILLSYQAREKLKAA